MTITITDDDGTDLELWKSAVWKAHGAAKMSEIAARLEVKWHPDTRKETYIIFSRSGYEQSLRKYAKEHRDVVLR